MPLGPGETWQLVIISDSSLWGVGDALADRIEKDTGVLVEYVDYATGSSARDVLDALQTGKSPSMALEKLPAVLKDAEYVVVFLNYQFIRSRASAGYGSMLHASTPDKLRPCHFRSMDH